MRRWTQVKPRSEGDRRARRSAGRAAHGTFSPSGSTLRFFRRRPGAPASRRLAWSGFGGLLAILSLGAAFAPVAGAGSQAGASPGTVTLTAAPRSTVADQPVVLTAVVRGSVRGASPEGALSFLEGRTALIGCGSVRVDADALGGTYRCRAVFGVQKAALTAVFLPSRNSTVAGATSPVLTLPVTRAPTALVLRLAPAVVTGVPTTISAQLTLPAHDTGAIHPEAPIRLLDGGAPIPGCPPAIPPGLVISCTVTYGGNARHTISAGFPGDDDYRPAAAPAAVQTAVATRGQIGARLHWRFAFTPAATRVLQLTASGMPAGATATVSCRGRGCPAASGPGGDVTKFAATGADPISLDGPVANRRLAPGATLTVAMTEPGFVGREYRFLIRRGAQPTAVIACLTPGSAIPGSGCLLAGT